MEYTNIINVPLKKENSFINKLDHVMIFLLIYLSSSFYALTLPGMLTLGVQYGCIFIIFVMSMLSGRKISINSNMAVKVLTLIAIIGMGSMSARGDDSKQTIINFSYILIAFFYALNYEFDDFVKKFVKVVYFLCVYSLLVYFVSNVIPDAVAMFPQIENVNGYKVYNFIFSVVYPSVRLRNPGVFWEPGAFQTYINLALIIELFYFKDLRKKHLIVYTLTLFTTYSTAGYIAALFIAYTYVTQLLLTSNEKNKNSTKNLFFILTVVLIVAVVFASMDTSVSRHVFGKFSSIEGTKSGSISSASVRMDAFSKPFKIFWEYPMFGAGTRGMNNFAINERYSMNTCTFINWFAYFGVFYGAMMMQMFYKFAKRFSNNKLIIFMIFFAIFLATATENYYRNPSILVFAFFILPKEEERGIIEKTTQYQQL